jgi:hypothetical protein
VTDVVSMRAECYRLVSFVLILVGAAHESVDVPLVGPNVDVVVIVTTARHHFAQRMQVRGSWAADPDPRVRVLFSAGRDACGVPYAHRLMCESTGKPLACDVNETAAASASAATERAHHADHIKGEQEKLLAEQAQYNDVLLLPVVDVYRHLARKKKLAFKWVHDHTQARFAMKVHGMHADDSFNYYYCTMA